MRQIGNDYVFDADDEEPDCLRCCHVCNYSSEYCYDFCGPDHGWAEYERLEKITSKSDVYDKLKEKDRLCKYCSMSLECDHTCKVEYIDHDKAYLMGEMDD